MDQNWSALNRLKRQQDALYHRCARRAGLTDTKFWLLYAVCTAGGVLGQNAFCEGWCCSKQTVSAAAAGLEADGLIVLHFAAGSKKQKELHLTAEGEAFCGRYIRPVLCAERRAGGALEAADRRKLLGAMEQLLGALEDALEDGAENDGKVGKEWN